MTDAAEATAQRVKLLADRFTLTMAAACLIGLGGFLGWAGFAPLEEGVAASGVVVVETDRQVVQHLEGGIIQEIRVREGDHVAAGDVLVVLQETASLASRDQVSQEIAALRASVARLTAVQSGAAAPDFTVLDGLDIGGAERADIVDREGDLFAQQREALAADIAVLATRRRGALTTAELKDNEIEFARKSLQATVEELELISTMVEQQLVRRDRLTNLEREAAELEGDIARLESEKEQAQAEARDLDVQIQQRRAQAAQDVAAERREVNARLLAAEESLSAAQDVLNRAVIVAPVAGEVLNLAFATRGGVVRPGEPILELVPETGSVTASVRIRPVDRASVFEGQTVRTQVSAYRSWRSPSLNGQITDVSADLLTDPATGAVYYEARVGIPSEALAEAPALEIIPGMPVEVFIFAGSSRTMLDYLLEPISASLFKGLRSQ